MNEKQTLEFLKVDNNSPKAVFMLHGYGASMNDLYGLAGLIDKDKKYNWYFPNGHVVINLGYHMQGRAWFPIDMQALEQAMMAGTFRNFKDLTPPGMQEAIIVLKEFIQPIANDYDEVILGGFSQGAMLTSHLCSEIDKVKAALLFSGVLVAQDELIKKLDHSPAFPFFQSHGKSDPVLNYAEATQLFELLKLYRWRGDFIGFDGAHEIPMNVIEKASRFLSSLD